MTGNAATRLSRSKRRVMTSYDKISDELKGALKLKYPDGFTDHMSRVDKPNGDFFYGVMLETEDSIYFVKLAVKIDDKAVEEIDKDLFASGEDEVIDLKGAEDIADTQSDDE